MAVESSSTSIMDSLLENLKLDEPWVQPRSWDSIPSQSAPSSQPPSSHSSSARYTAPTVSEASLVRLSINALQGVESALISIEKLSTLLCCSSADRTSHRIPSLWTWSSSTAALGNLLTSIGQFGCIVFLLHRFVDYFTIPDFGDVAKLQENLKSGSCEERKCPLENWSLINQAFAISVGKVIDGYISALNTLSASVSLRRLLKTKDVGCLTSIGHSDITLLEVYLHTTGLRTQIETLGNICNVNHLSVNFPVSSLENLGSKADTEFIAFPRSGALLSFLYTQLKVADPDHHALFKFLFLKAYEPYCDFIRSWIFDGSISDPYHEFVVECTNELSVYTSRGTGILSDSPLPNIRVRDGAAVPCFLEDCLVPLCRTGQQLQVIMKLLELSNAVGTCDTHEEILPCLNGLSSECPWFAFPLAFDKGTIDTMVLARASYYQQMQEKIASILPKFDFSYREAASQSVSWGFRNNLGTNLDNRISSAGDGGLMPQINDENPNRPDTIVDSEVSSTMDEYSCAEDLLESSECSSSGSFEAQDETEKLYFGSHNVEPIYLSALDFSSSLSTDNIMQNLNQSENSCSTKDFQPNTYQNSGCAAYSSHKETYTVNGEQKFSQTPETWAKSSEDNLHLFDGHRVSKGMNDTLLHSPDLGLELRMGSCMPNTNLDVLENATNVNAISEDHHQLVTCAASKTFNLHFSKPKYDSSFFSMNPALNRGSFFIPRSMFGERGPANCMDSYDFTSVKDPLETNAFKMKGDRRPKFGNELSFKIETRTARVKTSNYLDKADYNDITIKDHCKSSHGGSLMHEKGGSEEHLSLPNISGGSAWESLLGKFGNTVNRSASDHRTRLVSGADVPLDFVVNKCVLDEILLQYHYLSKLSIKLLIEGFKLQEHLQALRCYHFMELADWADLFIMSLWRCKWHASEMDKMIPQIQGVLELAVQRSSCEGDPNKDRLYVYLKDGIRTLSASAMGIHSFDFLGLGYRVDWPVSIILTPAALNIYSEIFNFLIQVKLAVFSLSNSWCSLKGYCMEQHKGEVHQISVLIETRHKINHFVSILQQYVQSQLSQVSWYRLLQSLKQKVKDMLDLESVHMAYLTESLHICFLSNETRPIAGIIQKILQCAMDFGSCLTGSLLGAGSDDDQLTNRINISQVHSIRRSFDKHLEELHLIYLQSHKHSEFGVSRFWDSLNYNDYYAGVMSKQMGHCIFY